jgi:hypothetical protein
MDKAFGGGARDLLKAPSTVALLKSATRAPVSDECAEFSSDIRGTGTD